MIRPTHLVMRAGGRTCALALTRVREVLRPLALRPLPSADPAVVGAAIVRGEACPVLDLAMVASGGAGDQRPALGGQRSAAGDERPAAGGRRTAPTDNAAAGGDASRARWVLVRGAQRGVVLAVDAVLGARRLADDAARWRIDDARIRAFARWGDDVVLLLDELVEAPAAG